MGAIYDVLIPLIAKTAEISFFLAMSLTVVRFLVRAASGRDSWLK